MIKLSSGQHAYRVSMWKYKRRKYTTFNNAKIYSMYKKHTWPFPFEPIIVLKVDKKVQ